jgi:hypothetical protein
MDVILTPHRVEIFTASYHLSGELPMRGTPGLFLNDHVYPVFTVVGSLIRPMAQGAEVAPLDVPECFVPKETIEVVGLPDIDMKEMHLMPSIRRLVCLTETYMVKGEFHTGAESGPADLFYFAGGPFFPATNVEIRAVRPVASPVELSLPLAYVHRDAVRVLYRQDEPADAPA